MPSVLKRGANGAAVEALQRGLRRAGFDIAVDGGFGMRTDAAVCAFQAEHGLARDGVVGDRTWGVLAGFDSAPEAPARDPIRRHLRDVPWLSQRDNANRPGGTCNVTCLAMVLQSYGVRPADARTQLEDEIFRHLDTNEARAWVRTNHPALANVNPWNVHYALEWVVNTKYGSHARSRFVLDATWEALERTVVDEQRPVILTGGFTQSGHIVALVGFTVVGDLVVNDPYGDWRGAPSYGVQAGQARIYPRSDMENILSGGRPGPKYAHFLTPVA